MTACWRRGLVLGLLSVAGCCGSKSTTSPGGESIRRTGEPGLETIPADFLGMKESVKAAPKWAPNAVAPPLKDGSEAFRAAKKPVKLESMKEGLLICQVTASKNRAWDSIPIVVLPGINITSAPDIAVKATAGRLPQLVLTRGQDSYEMVFSIPQMTLDSGQEIRIDAVDQDLGEDDPMGQATGTFSGEFPIELKSSSHDMTVSCGMMSPLLVDERLKARVASYDQRKAIPLASLKADPKQRDCGYPSDTLGAMKLSLQDMAAYVGWARTEVRTRVDKFEELESAWEPLATEAMKKAHQELPAPGGYSLIVGSQFQGKVESAWCEEKGLPILGLSVSDCTMDMVIKNTGPKTKIVASGMEAISFSLADPAGKWHDVTSFGLRGTEANAQTVNLATGEELPIRLRVLMDGNAFGAGSTHILVVKTKTGTNLFRVPSSGKI